MTVSIKSALKPFGIAIVCFCAVFVCTFFLNYYLDVLPLESQITAELMPLYKAQLATARMTCAVTGGFLAAVAAVMLVFYIRLYIDNHSAELGTLKAMGYDEAKLARGFAAFGMTVFLGCALGFAAGWAYIPAAYKSLSIDGLPQIAAKFHPTLLLLLVIAPAAVLATVSVLFAYVTLKKPCLVLIRGEAQKTKQRVAKQKRESAGSKPFIRELGKSVITSKKSLAGFIAFSCFCFSSTVQMGISMETLVEGSMGMLILGIGVVLAAVSIVLAMTSLVKFNSKTIAVMKAMGYSAKERFIAVFVFYIPFAAVGFILGTAYQFGLLTLMINLIFKDVGNVPEYTFDVKALFITLALFVVAYTAAFAFFARKADKLPVKQIMLES